MAKHHLKRLAMPKTWRLDRKNIKFAIRPLAGKNFNLSIPLGTALKEMLNVCSTTREAKAILTAKLVLVDGKVRQDIHYPVGIFDVVTLTQSKKEYRLVLDDTGKLMFTEAKDPTKTLCKITGKTTIRGGKIQLNCLNGRNILVEGKHEYNTGDVIVLQDNKVTKHLKFAPGMICVLTFGKHGGEVGTIAGIEGSNITVKTTQGTFETLKEYAYVVGDKQPEISIGA